MPYLEATAIYTAVHEIKEKKTVIRIHTDSLVNVFAFSRRHSPSERIQEVIDGTYQVLEDKGNYLLLTFVRTENNLADKPSRELVEEGITPETY